MAKQNKINKSKSVKVDLGRTIVKPSKSIKPKAKKSKK